MMNKKVYISIDGNEIGKKIEKYILADQLEELKQFSEDLSYKIKEISRNIEIENGEIYMSGGDNLLAVIPSSSMEKIIDIVKTFNENKQFSFSIGIGSNSIGAYFALKYAKANNKYAIQYVDDSFVEVERCD